MYNVGNSYSGINTGDKNAPPTNYHNHHHPYKDPCQDVLVHEMSMKPTHSFQNSKSTQFSNQNENIKKIQLSSN